MTRSSSLRVISSNSSRFAGYSGCTRLTTPDAVPSATPPASPPSSGARASTVSPSARPGTNSSTGWPPASEPASPDVRRGDLDDADPDHPAGQVTAPMRARAVVVTAARDDVGRPVPLEDG